MVTQNLVETKEGIYLPNGSAKKLYDRSKTLIVKSKLFRAEVNKLLYFMDSELCYGILKLKHPDKISLQNFEELKDKHLLTDECRRKWWPNKQVLFAYNFDVITTFKKPRKITMRESSDFVRSFEFLDVQEMMIKEASNYDPLSQTNKQLGDDLKIVTAWHKTKTSGGYVKYSLEEIKNLADKILEEIKKRVDKGEMKYNFVVKKEAKMSIEPFVPTVAAYQFDNIYEAVEYMFRNGDKFIVEKKLPGERCMLIKEGNNIHLYNEKKRDVTDKHPDIVAEASIITENSIALDCQLSKKILYIIDCVYYNEDITDVPLSDRKSIIHSLNFTKHIKENPSIVVSNSEDAKKGLILMRTIQNSEGALIKKYEGTYSAEDDWIELNKKLDPHTTTETKGIDEVSGEKEGEKVDSPEEQGEEDPKAKEWDEKKTEEKEDQPAESEEKPQKEEAKPVEPETKEEPAAETKTEEVKENAETTTATPGIADVQGEKKDKKKKPCQKK
jgi:hypothetical protein